MSQPKSESGKGSEAELLFPIGELCKFIKPYKGDRETLTAFLTNCKEALDMASASQRIFLFKFILAQLEGKAQIACSNKVFDNFDTFKTFLKQNFGERKHYNHLLIDLQSCKQQANETVAQYALRIESCLTDLQSEIHNSDSLKKDLSGRIAMTEDLALHTFLLGLHPRLGNNVRCRSPKALNDAVNIAIEEEKIQNLLYKSTFKPKCKTCGKPGHSESECPSKHKFIPQSRTFSKPQPSTSQQNSLFCRYCKNAGHDISQCRKRKFNNEKYRNNSNQNSNNPTVNHVTHESASPLPSPTFDPIACDNIEFDDDLN